MAFDTYNNELNNVYKTIGKIYKIFKPRLQNVLSAGTDILNVWLSLCLIGCVRSVRYCGKMYNHHLFSYGGLERVVYSYRALQRVGLIYGTTDRGTR